MFFSVRMAKLVERVSRTSVNNLVIFSTILITVLSVSITSITLLIFQGYIDRLGIIICIVAPVVIFPAPAKIFFSILFRLKATERELRTKNLALEQALSDVKTLSGLLPICCSCKKIRDDQGYWRDVEHYICSHSNIQLSHGYCPECIEKLYPQLQIHFPDQDFTPMSSAQINTA